MEGGSIFHLVAMTTVVTVSPFEDVCRYSRWLLPRPRHPPPIPPPRRRPLPGAERSAARRTSTRTMVQTRGSFKSRRLSDGHRCARHRRQYLGSTCERERLGEDQSMWCLLLFMRSRCCCMAFVRLLDRSINHMVVALCLWFSFEDKGGIYIPYILMMLACTGTPDICNRKFIRW